MTTKISPKLWNEEYSPPQCVTKLSNFTECCNLFIYNWFFLMNFIFQLSSLPDLIPALTAAEQRAAASLKWRTHEKLLQKYACLPHVISSDQIYYRFLQRMFTIMMTNVSSVPFILLFWTHGWVWNYQNSSYFQNSGTNSVHSILPRRMSAS